MADNNNHEETNGKERSHQATYENEVAISRSVTIPLHEYEKLKEQQSTITDKSLIAIIDKIEELVRAMIKMRIKDENLNAVVDKKHRATGFQILVIVM